MADLFIGTSGWHYNDWLGLFYPPEFSGYKELTYHARHFNTAENNSSFYRIATEPTYKTWNKVTPDGYKFSLKLNRSITHLARLELTNKVKETVNYIITSTQVLEEKLGAILIQLPASFRYDLLKVEQFLAYFCKVVRQQPHPFDIAIEFRNKFWLQDNVYALLKKYNTALVAAQSSRYPGVRQVTADIAYIRMHGPGKLFASSYSNTELQKWADYIRRLSKKVKRIYVYFNNDFHGYAIENAKELIKLLS